MKMTWKVEKVAKLPKLRNPILVEGLPGIGNVGKVAVDFIVDEARAVKLFDISSYSFPHSVFVNEENLVELPKIELYYKRFKNGRNDLLLLAGDVQPTDEISSYEFCDKILDISEQFKVKEIITLGGIGLMSIPKKPKVYCTANSKEIIKKYKNGTAVDDNLYGVVGPIVGVSGLLLGLAQKRHIKAISFLAETYGHPMYLGMKGARGILGILNKKLALNLNLKHFEKDIKELEEEMIKKTEELSNVSRKTALRKAKRVGEDVTYIG